MINYGLSYVGVFSRDKKADAVHSNQTRSAVAAEELIMAGQVRCLSTNKVAVNILADTATTTTAATAHTSVRHAMHALLDLQ